MDKMLRISSKSFFYNLISQNYHVYNTDEYNTFLVEKLVCSDCNSIWETSRQECYLCGTENYHVYTCTNCNHKISITRSVTNVCDGCDERDTFRQMCINEECITNTNEELKDKVIASGGVFGGNGGFSIRQMSCKKCGSRKNNYESAECIVVSNKEELDIPFSLYIDRTSPDKPAKGYWVKKDEKLIEFSNIESLMEYQIKRTE